MHDDSAGADAEITDLATSTLQVVVEGVGNIDGGRRRRTVGHQLELGGVDRSVAG